MMENDKTMFRLFYVEHEGGGFMSGTFLDIAFDDAIAHIEAGDYEEWLESLVKESTEKKRNE